MANYFIQEEATYTLDDLVEIEIDSTLGLLETEDQPWRFMLEEGDGFLLLEEPDVNQVYVIQPPLYIGG